MTNSQHSQSKPTYVSIIVHARQGCDIRHKTNGALDACERKIEEHALR